MSSDVKSFPARKPYRDLQGLHDSLWNEIRKFDGRASLAEVLGVLRLLERTVLENNDEQ